VNWYPCLPLANYLDLSLKECDFLNGNSTAEEMTRMILYVAGAARNDAVKLYTP
jgi:hypothetical protein